MEKTPLSAATSAVHIGAELLLATVTSPVAAEEVRVDVRMFGMETAAGNMEEVVRADGGIESMLVADLNIGFVYVFTVLREIRV